MADKYALTGNWSNANTWSLTDGGAPGAGAPSASENAFFSNLSGNVTIDTTADCLNFDATKGTGYTGTLTHTAQLNVNGSFTRSATMTVAGGSGIVAFVGANGTCTVTSAGKSYGSGVTIAKTAGNTVQLLDALTCAGNFTPQSGNLDQNGQAITSGSWQMGGSFGTYSNPGPISCAASVGVTIFGGQGRTYAAVTLTNNGNVTQTVQGANTFSSLTILNAALKAAVFAFDANQTVSGTFTATGNSLVNRLLLSSSVLGTARTITAATSNANANVDWQDIVGAGAGAPFTGTSLGDALGNSGITFTTPVTRYWMAVSGGLWDATSSWAASSNGATGASVPLIHDDVVIDANSITSGGRNIQGNMPRLGRNINFTGVLNSPNFQNGSSGATTNWYSGSLTFAAGMTLTNSGTNSLACIARSDVTLTTAGCTMPYSPYTVQCVGGSVSMQDAFGTGRIAIMDGTLITNSFSINTVYVNFSLTTRTRGITLGSSVVTLTGNDSSGSAPWNTGGVTGLTVSAGTSTMRYTDATAFAKSFTGGGKAYYNFWFAGSNGRLTISGNNSFNDLRIDPGTVAVIAGGSTQTAATHTLSGQDSLGGNEWFARFIGAAGGYFSGGDPAAFPTGTSAYIVDLTQEDYTPSTPPVLISKWADAGNQRSVIFDLSAAGNLRFAFSTDGTSGNSTTLTSSVPLGLTDGTRKKVAATFEPDGVGGTNVKFWTSDDAVAWTQLGTTQNTALPPTIFNSTAEVRIGQRSDAPSNVPINTIYRAWVTAAGLLDAKVIDFNPANFAGGGATWVSPTGETWTINGLVTVSATNLVTLIGSGAWNISKTDGGRTQQNYISVRSSSAVQTNTFYAANSLNVGSNPNWIFGGFIEADAGAYAMAGQDASLLAHRYMQCDAGAYTINGQDAYLIEDRFEGQRKMVITKDTNVFVMGR